MRQHQTLSIHKGPLANLIESYEDVCSGATFVHLCQKIKCLANYLATVNTGSILAEWLSVGAKLLIRHSERLRFSMFLVVFSQASEIRSLGFGGPLVLAMILSKMSGRLVLTNKVFCYVLIVFVFDLPGALIQRMSVSLSYNSTPHLSERIVVAGNLGFRLLIRWRIPIE